MNEKAMPAIEPPKRPAIEWTRRQFLGWSAMAGASLAFYHPLAAAPATGFTLGLVGLGERGHQALASCQTLSAAALANQALALPVIRVAAACDPRRAALRAVPVDVACFADLETLLARSEVDALVLAVPESAVNEVLEVSLEARKPVLLSQPLPDLERFLKRSMEQKTRLEVVPGLHLSVDRTPNRQIEAQELRSATLDFTAPSARDLAQRAPEALEAAWTLLGNGRVVDLQAIGGPGLVSRRFDIRGAIHFAVDEPASPRQRLDVRLSVRPHQQVSGRLAVGSRVEGVTSGLAPRPGLAPTPRDLVALATGRGASSLGLSLPALARGRDLYRRLVTAVS